MFDDDDPCSAMPSTERIPSVLLQEYLGSGHVLFTDNFYTSPSLAAYLLENDTHLRGTVKLNRKYYPKELSRTELEKGEAAVMKGENMLACKYRATKNKANNQPKVVYMLSTAHPSTIVETGKTDRDGNMVMKPRLITEYNLHMGGVDRVDQQLHSIQGLRKSYKWYRKLVLRLIMQMLLNSQKLYLKYSGNSKQDFLSFLHNVISAFFLCSTKLNRNDINLPDTVYRLTNRHFSEQGKPVPGSVDRRPSKKCRVCYAQGKRTAKGQPIKTVYICKSCPSEPGLNIDYCFEVYHTVLDYSHE